MKLICPPPHLTDLLTVSTFHSMLQQVPCTSSTQTENHKGDICGSQTLPVCLQQESITYVLALGHHQSVICFEAPKEVLLYVSELSVAHSFYITE